MKHILNRLTIIPLTIFLLISSCSKKDIYFASQQKENNTLAINKFLTLPLNSDPVLARITNTMQHQEDKYHFLGKVIQQHGYPLWQNAQIKIMAKPTQAGQVAVLGASPNHVLSGNATATNDTIVIIPLVQPNSTAVKAFISCKVNDTTVAIRLFNGNNYATYGFGQSPDSLNAYSLAATCMYLEYLAFGHKEFTIKDKRLFDYLPFGKQAIKRTFKININSNGNVATRGWKLVWYSYEVEDDDEGYVIENPNGLAPGQDLTIGTHTTTHYGSYWEWEDDHPNPNDNPDDPWGNGTGNGSGTGGHANNNGNDTYNTDEGWDANANPLDPGENFEFVFPSDPAIDLAKYFKCFDNVPDAGATYSVKLCADLPVNDKPLELQKNAQPGHSFITITKSNGNNSVMQSFGFYHKFGPLSLSMAAVSSKMVDNGGHEYNASVTMNNISQLDFLTIQNTAKSLGNIMFYDLNDFNCTTYALNIFNSIRPGNPISVANSIPGFDYGKTPDGLYQLLKNASPINNMLEVGTFNAPLGNGPCN